MEGVLPPRQPVRDNEINTVVKNTINGLNILFMILVSYPKVVKDSGSFHILLYEIKGNNILFEV